MEARIQRRVQRYGWDKAVSCYERYWSEQLAPAQQRAIELADARPGERVLDVACGTGLVTFPLLDAVGPRGAVTATDVSGAMVAHIARLAVERGLGHLSAARMDAERLELPDASFDLASCALGLMYVPEPENAIREMVRVLEPGGRAVIAVWGRRDRCGWAEIFPIVERRVASDVCPLFFRLGTGDVLRAMMAAAGLESIAVSRLSTVLSYRSADDACGAAFAGGPVALAYSRFDEGTRASAHAEYLESIDGWRRGAGYEVPGEFVVARGWKANLKA